MLRQTCGLLRRGAWRHAKAFVPGLHGRTPADSTRRAHKKRKEQKKKDQKQYSCRAQPLATDLRDRGCCEHLLIAQGDRRGLRRPRAAFSLRVTLLPLEALTVMPGQCPVGARSSRYRTDISSRVDRLSAHSRSREPMAAETLALARIDRTRTDAYQKNTSDLAASGRLTHGATVSMVRRRSELAGEPSEPRLDDYGRGGREMTTRTDCNHGYRWGSVAHSA